MDTLYPRERDRRPRIAAPATPAPPVSDPAAARTWLDAEQPNLLAAVAHTAGHHWPTRTRRLATTLAMHHNTGGMPGGDRSAARNPGNPIRTTGPASPSAIPAGGNTPVVNTSQHNAVATALGRITSVLHVHRSTGIHGETKAPEAAGELPAEGRGLTAGHRRS